MMHDTEALNRWAEFAMKAIPDRKDPIAVTMVEAQWLFWPGERGGGGVRDLHLTPEAPSSPSKASCFRMSALCSESFQCTKSPALFTEHQIIKSNSNKTHTGCGSFELQIECPF